MWTVHKKLAFVEKKTEVNYPQQLAVQSDYNVQSQSMYGVF